MNGPRRFGELLLERGFVSPEQLREALRLQTTRGKRLGEILLEMGILSSDQLNWALSEILGVPYVELTEDMVDLELVRRMPEEVLRRHQAVPILRVGNELTVILADPKNQQAVLELEALGGATIRTAMASGETVNQLLDKAFPRSAGGRDRVVYADLGPISRGTQGDATGAAQTYSLFLDAVREQATEIHLEPLLEEIRVRYRVDGGLVEQPRLSRSVLGPMLSRLRILAGLRGATLPVEARVRTRLEGQEVELDLLFFPTLYGEAATVNIWPRGPEAPTLESLELAPASRDAVAALLAARSGLVFVTGWEPRARTALLYAMAQAAATPITKTLTLERAVSWVIPDFVQVEVPGEFGTTSAAILEQPADIALVEDVSSPQASLAAFASAERGGLVLGGLPFATNARALAHLLALDAPRAPLLAAVRGLAHVRRVRHHFLVEVLSVTDELRRELGSRLA